MDSNEEHGSGAERDVLRATRALLHVEGRRDVRDIAVRLVQDLGGEVVEARAAGDDAADVVPVDLSFGAGPTLLARPHNGVARLLLERFLPSFVEDGARAVALVRAAPRSGSGREQAGVTRDEDLR